MGKHDKEMQNTHRVHEEYSGRVQYINMKKGYKRSKGFLSNWFSNNHKGNSRENFTNCVMKK